MASCLGLVQFARLAMRPVHWFLEDRWSATKGLEYQVMVTMGLSLHVKWWSDPLHLSEGTELQYMPSVLTVTKDTSMVTCMAPRSILLQGEWADVKALHMIIW